MKAITLLVAATSFLGGMQAASAQPICREEGS